MRPDGPRDPVAGPENGPEQPFPLRLRGKVIRGFGRGSKELGIPTANIPIEGLSVGGHRDVESGVYYGWAGLSPSLATGHHITQSGPVSQLGDVAREVVHGVEALVSGESGSNDTGAKCSNHIDRGPVFPMVMSIGWNPFYKNTVRSVEVHIMHEFAADFYDSQMNIVILGFIRPEYDYVSKESLIEDIKTDMKVAEKSLGRKAYAELQNDPYLIDFTLESDVAH